MLTRICSKCLNEKEISYFSNKKRKLKSGEYNSYLSSQCKTCENKSQYERRKSNPITYERLKQRARNRSKKKQLFNPLAVSKRVKIYIEKRKKDGTWKDKWLQDKYGIGINLYNEMLKQQNNSCKICKRHETIFKRPLHVDHCHDTGKIRGLLCSNCNTALGSFQDNISILEGAILYLQSY